MEICWICIGNQALTKFETISAFDVVDVIAVFTVVLGVGVIESQAIAADFQRSHSIYAFPVFVAGNVVSEEAVFLRANKRIAANVLGRSCRDWKKVQVTFELKSGLNFEFLVNILTEKGESWRDWRKLLSRIQSSHEKKEETCSSTLHRRISTSSGKKKKRLVDQC